MKIATMVLFAAVLCCTPARADDNTGSIDGRLLSPNGSPAASATVYLDGPHAVMQTNTDADGRFAFFNVLPGYYELYMDPQFEIAGACASNPIFNVRPGLTWHLPAFHYIRRSQDIYKVCPAVAAQPPLHQLTSAGTTADLYLVP